MVSHLTMFTSFILYFIKFKYINIYFSERGIEYEEIDFEESTDTGEPIQLKDLDTSKLKLMLAPYFQRKGIDEKYLAVFDEEKIDGEVFASRTTWGENVFQQKLDGLFAEMPFGDRWKFKNIVTTIIDEHYITSLKSSRNRNITIPRCFNTAAEMKFYKNGSVLEIPQFSESSDLTKPIHIFGQNSDQVDISLPKSIAMESAKFAGACLTNRRNGTIHFGVSQIVGSHEGKVVGLPIAVPDFMQIFYDEIKRCFHKDQLDIVLQCLRPPELIRVTKTPKKETRPLYVVEIDVVPKYETTHFDTFYVKDSSSEGDSVGAIYTFLKSELTVLQKDQLRKYMEEKICIAQKRKTEEFSIGQRKRPKSHTDGCL